MCTADGRVFGSVAEALRMANATMDYLNGPDAGRPGRRRVRRRCCGRWAEIEAKFTAAHAAVLARFDAADAHDCDGYGTSAAWLDAMADMTRPDAKAEVRRMRLLRDHPEMAAALADADISKSLGAGDRRVDEEAPGGAARGDDHDPGAGRPAGRVAG